MHANGQSWLQYYNQSVASLESGEYEKSYEEISRSLEFYLSEDGAVNESYASILRQYGNTCFYLERYDEGIAKILKEIEIRSINQDQKLADARLNLAEFYKQQKSFSLAIEQIELGTKIFEQYLQPDAPQLVSCRLNLAVTLFYSGQQDRSFEILSEYLSKSDFNNVSADDYKALYIYGILLRQSGNLARAYQAFEKIKPAWQNEAELNDYIDLLQNLGQLEHQLRNYTSAEDYYSEAISLSEKNETDAELKIALASDRAINLQALGRGAEANQIIESLEKQNLSGNKYATLLTNRATYYQGKGDWAQAEKLYNEALQKFNKSEPEGALLFADAQSNLAILKSELGDQETALQLLQEAQKTYAENDLAQSVRYVLVLNKLGSVYVKSNNFALANKVLNESLIICKQQPNQELLTAQTLTLLGSLAYKEGKIKFSDSIFTLVIKSYSENNWQHDANFLYVLNNLASVKQMLAKYKESNDLIDQMSRVAATVYGRNSVFYAVNLNSKAELDLKAGNVAKAKIALDSAEHIYRTLNYLETTEYAQLLATKARHFLMLGNYNLAEPQYREALNIIRKIGGTQSIEYAQLLNSEALLYQTLGNYSEAEKLLQQSMKVVEAVMGKNNTEYSTVLQNMATLMQLQGKYNQAEKMLEEAQAIDKVVLGEMHPQYAVVVQNLAALYQKTGRSSEAELLLNIALKNYEFNYGKINASYATTVANLASLYQDQKKWSQAELTWNECLSIRKKLVGEEHPDYARAQMGLAGLYHAQARYAEAEVMYNSLLKNYQRQVRDFFPGMSEREKTAFFAKVKSVFDSYIDFAVEYANASEGKRQELLINIYNIQLVNKAILLNTSSKIRSRILNSNDAKLLSQYQEWLHTKETIVKWYTQFSIQERQSVKVEELETLANDLEKSLSLQSDLFKEEVGLANVTFDDVKNALTSSEAAVELIRISKRYVKDSVYYLGLTVRNNYKTPELLVFQYGNKLENRYFKYLRNSIRFNLRDTISYGLFWQPIYDKIGDAATVFISCDGVFNKVNFNVLHDRDADRFVIDKWLIRRVGNTKELVEIRKDNNYEKPLQTATLLGYADFNLNKTDVVVANSTRSIASSFGFVGEEIPVLPATQTEVDMLEQLLSQKQLQVNKFMQASATEENLKSKAGSSVLHIATHGFFLEDLNQDELTDEDEVLSNPMFKSGILLSGAGVPAESRGAKEDGVLTAFEAMNLNLESTELVSLSACETGLGTIQNGEGVFGLQRSFLMAGASSLLMSLWQVEDVATQKLMVDFYSLWLGGADKHEAFRQAQLKNKDQYADPYYWGGFIMIGK